MKPKNVYEDALLAIARPKYGLQGIIEDYGHDTNRLNYESMLYYKKLCEQYQKTASKALYDDEDEL